MQEFSNMLQLLPLINLHPTFGSTPRATSLLPCQ